MVVVGLWYSLPLVVGCLGAPADKAGYRCPEGVGWFAVRHASERASADDGDLRRHPRAHAAPGTAAGGSGRRTRVYKWTRTEASFPERVACLHVPARGCPCTFNPRSDQTAKVAGL
eukprot:scaffold1_cov402-Prasinococcus_capsulatus_cf.AAC.9